jgi:hypothetical protein
LDRVGLPLAVAGVAAWVYRRSLGYYFSQDAFTLLARVRGLTPSPPGAWRLLSGPGYFRLMDVLFGLNPVPYHVVTLALHALNAALTYRLARRVGLSPGAAAFGAVFFAGHIAHFDAIYAVTGAGELLAAALVLVGLLAALPTPGRDPAPWRSWVVTACYAAALLSKETVVLFPALLALAARLRPSVARAALLPCAALGALYLASFWLGDPFGFRGEGIVRNPYQPAWGVPLLQAWATHVSWTFHALYFALGDLNDSVGPHPEGWVASAAAAALLVALALRARRDPSARGPLAAAGLGAGHFLAFILPVLPLARHAYHYYLYLPLVGAGLLLAAVLDVALRRRVRAVVWVAAALLAANAAAAVRVAEESVVPGTNLQSFGVLRRARVAERVLGELAQSPAPLPEDLVVLGPHPLRPTSPADTTWLGRYLFVNVRTALDEGRAIRVTFPHVQRVRFAADLGQWLDRPDVVVVDYEGLVQRGPTALLYLSRAEAAARAGMARETRDAAARAEELAARWMAELPAGPWRTSGAAGIRRRARTVLAALPTASAGEAPPARAAWREARERLGRLSGLAF